MGGIENGRGPPGKQNRGLPTCRGPPGGQNGVFRSAEGHPVNRMGVFRSAEATRQAEWGSSVRKRAILGSRWPISVVYGPSRQNPGPFRPVADQLVKGMDVFRRAQAHLPGECEPPDLVVGQLAKRMAWEIGIFIWRSAGADFRHPEISLSEAAFPLPSDRVPRGWWRWRQ